MKKLFILYFIMFFACSENLDNLKTSFSTERKSFTSNKSKIDQKLEFDLLTFKERSDLWKSKLYQIKNSTSKYNSEINQLIEILSNASNQDDLIDNEQLKTIAYNLALQIPKSEYISMFNSLEDYKIQPNNNSKIDKNFAQQVKDGFSIIENQNERIEDNPECNCGWTCGGSESECTHSQCESTSYGCGFLWLQSCTDRDELFAEDCPKN